MKNKITWLAGFVLLFALHAVAQEQFTEGPVWRVTIIKVKPAQFDAYMATLRQGTKPLLDEEKRQGLILSLARTWSEERACGIATSRLSPLLCETLQPVIIDSNPPVAGGLACGGSVPHVTIRRPP